MIRENVTFAHLMPIIGTLAVVTVASVGRAAPPSMAQREMWNLARSEFALAAQSAARPLGDLSFTLPLPTASDSPDVEGVLDEAAWPQMAEKPFRRAGPTGLE